MKTPQQIQDEIWAHDLIMEREGMEKIIAAYITEKEFYTDDNRISGELMAELEEAGYTLEYQDNGLGTDNYKITWE